MKLLRVQVPNFRALKDVDISFEPDFVPNIFPIGSQNGGGKSTLLQLIFILLHCSHDPGRKIYIKYLLKNFREAIISDSYSLAKIKLEYCREVFSLDFFCRSQTHPEIQDILANQKGLMITDISDTESSVISHLICKVEKQGKRQPEHVHPSRVQQLLEEFSSKIFLVLPENPIFLFLQRQSNRHLLQSNSMKDYSDDRSEIYGKLPGLFTYSFLAVDFLLGVFQKARDLDFQQAIETGEYGRNYQELLNEFNHFLGGVKQVNVVSYDLDEVTFYRPDQGKHMPLYPEDLSRGEMKRLSLYVWLKKHETQDSVVMIDEIETALHPDWQYQIVSDLATWAPSNQYLLATHSYELCQALTPAHVKEIPPKLLKQPATAS
jgi:predicted ATPase